MEHSRLAALPRELRDMIYDELLVVKNDVTISVSYPHGHKGTLTFQGGFEHEDITSNQLCKQCHIEISKASRRDRLRNHFPSKTIHFEISDEFREANSDGIGMSPEKCGTYDYKHSIAHTWINAVGIDNARSVKSADLRLGVWESKWTHGEPDWVLGSEAENLLSLNIEGEVWRFGDEFQRLGVPTTFTLQLHKVHEDDPPCEWRKNRCCDPDHFSRTVTLPITDVGAANKMLNDMYMEDLRNHDDTLERGEMRPDELEQMYMQLVWRHETLQDLMERLEDRVEMLKLTPGWFMESDGRWQYIDSN